MLIGAHDRHKCSIVKKKEIAVLYNVYNYCISGLHGKTSRTQLTGEEKCMIACRKVRIGQSEDETAVWLSKDRNYNSP